MKITIKPRHNSHENDCWCDAIAMLTKQNYDKVYKMFKPMLYKDGGLDGGVITGYLEAKGYLVLEVNIDLYKAINVYNTSNGILFRTKGDENSKNYHIFYMKGNVIYNTEKDTYIEKMLYEQKVVNVIMKLENDYE